MNETEKRIEKLEKGCDNEFCGKIIYFKDKTKVDTLCLTCGAKFRATNQTLKEVGEVIDDLENDKEDDLTTCEKCENDILKELKKELGLEKEKSKEKI